MTLVHAIGSADDSVYDALADQSVTVTITENDAVGVTIDPTTLTVTEGDAGGASYTVALTSQPAGDVTIAISGHSGTDLTLSGTTLSEDGELTFTTENWGTAQTVTVKAAEDVDAVADGVVTLVHAIGSANDSVYDALGRPERNGHHHRGRRRGDGELRKGSPLYDRGGERSRRSGGVAECSTAV